MNEFNQMVQNLAETYGKNPDEFINVLENLFKILPDKKGGLFLDTGIVLFNFSYFRLALVVWNKALEYYIDI
ncbi:unnamed protein product, partial [marine sediment metagenome]